MKILKDQQDLSIVEIFPAKITNILKTRIPSDAVFDVNNYLDALLVDKDKVSATPNLAAEIKKGEQLQLDFNDDNLKPISSFILDISKQYCEKFYEDCNMPFFNYKYSISSMWSIHQYEGDYNPLHTHDTESELGLSCFLYLKIPDSIKKSSMLNKTISFKGGGGIFDGNTDLVFGHSSSPPNKSFKFPNHISIIPDEGVLYLFPKWVPHLVYPFSGPGERRSISANINIF